MEDRRREFPGRGGNHQQQDNQGERPEARNPPDERDRYYGDQLYHQGPLSGPMVGPEVFDPESDYEDDWGDEYDYDYDGDYDDEPYRDYPDGYYGAHRGAVLVIPIQGQFRLAGDPSGAGMRSAWIPGRERHPEEVLYAATMGADGRFSLTLLSGEDPDGDIRQALEEMHGRRYGGSGGGGGHGFF